ncbi:MAG: hypothetical protein ACI9DC_000821 [Gammaproteobacteria bacterium]|jgi:hypothetical protein
MTAHAKPPVFLSLGSGPWVFCWLPVSSGLWLPISRQVCMKGKKTALKILATIEGIKTKGRVSRVEH